MRILFSCECSDSWILDAYKSIFDQLKTVKDLELYGTFEDVADAKMITEYNIIDYDKISHGCVSFTPDINASYDTYIYEKVTEIQSVYNSNNEMLERLFIFKIVLSMVQPDLIILWNGMADIRGLIKEYLIYQKINFLYAEKGLLPNSWYIDEVGINPLSSLASMTFDNAMSDKDKDSIEQYIENIVANGVSSWDQPSKAGSRNETRKKLGISLHDNVIFFPGQVDNDTNITMFSSFKDMCEVVRIISNCLPSETVLVVKPHPKASASCKTNLEELIKQSDRIILSSDTNVWDLVDVSDLVISINSTVAFEAMLRKKKIILLGDSLLTKVGLVDKTNINDLSNRIRMCMAMELDDISNYNKVLMFTKFLINDYYLFRNLPISEYVNRKLNSAAIAISNKIFTKNELWNILYGKSKDTHRNYIGKKKIITDIALSFLKGMES